MTLLYISPLLRFFLYIPSNFSPLLLCLIYSLNVKFVRRLKFLNYLEITELSVSSSFYV